MSRTVTTTPPAAVGMGAEMPTGYTAALHDGEQEFEDFFWGAARAMGAFVTLRDSPKAKIPDEFTQTCRDCGQSHKVPDEEADRG